MIEIVPILSGFGDSITHILHSMGYTGVFIIMILESAGLPIPSEIVMPYGGFLASKHGPIDLLLGAIIGCAGTAIGSAIEYGIARWGGRAFIIRYGKYLHITPARMAKAERFFHKYGESACIYTRLMPVIRSIVNLPAGLLNMNFYKFIAYTMIGAFPWCFILAALGYMLGDRWEKVTSMGHELTLAFLCICGLLILAAIVIYTLVRMKIIPKETVERYTKFLKDI